MLAGVGSHICILSGINLICCLLGLSCVQTRSSFNRSWNEVSFEISILFMMMWLCCAHFHDNLVILCCLQENMSVNEIEAAIHTDSKHADKLRSVYSSRETADCGYVIFKRLKFLGSRRSFEMLKRVSGENNSNVYELLIRA